MTRKSEFGRGYKTCLIQFTFHEPRLTEYLRDYAEMHEKYPDSFTPHGAIDLWANGASDHLSEMVHPRSGVPWFEWAVAKQMAWEALDAGHGFRGHEYSEEDARHWIATARRLIGDDQTFEAAVAWDKAHGLAPQAGEWSCQKPIPAKDALAR